MKKLYTLLYFAFVSYALSAQISATSSILLDYDGNDQQYSTDNSFDYSAYLWKVNSRYTNTDNLTLRYAVVRLDTIQFTDANNTVTFYPRTATTLRLDSFVAAFVHTNVTGNIDSIHFTVFNTAAMVVTGYGTPAATLTTPILWDTLIVTNQSIPLTTPNYTFATFTPGISLPQGQTFGIRVDFKGDTANSFNMVAGYRDQCAAACAAEISIAGNNSGYYLNMTTQPQVTNISGYFENNAGGAIYYDCDQSGAFTPGGCENFEIQNFWMYAYTSATTNYGVVVTGDSLNGCPGTTLTLNANAFGSNATPYTYSWAATSGTLTSSSDQQVGFVVGNSNAVITVTVTDANNNTVSTTAVVTTKGITISITNPNPLTINCGTNATVTTQIAGSTTGKNYTWSTGASGTTQATLQVNTPASYSVTVTNNTGCSATASINVQYPGNLNNQISFVNPSPPNCEDAPITFINTSQRVNGWNYTWNFGDATVGFTLNGVNTYTNPGVYTVYLRQDSASCVFQSNSVAITVLAASNAMCLNHALSITLGGPQSVCNGSIVILNPLASNGSSPYTYNWANTGSPLSCYTCNHPSATITQYSVYTVTVVDATNQTASASVSYTMGGGSNHVQASVTSTAITCANPSSTAVVTVTGGTSPYTFDWGNATSNSGTSPQNHNYGNPGVYVITIIDSGGCIATILDTVVNQGINITASQEIHPVCEHSNTGKIKLSTTGGNQPYSFQWSNGATADSINGVPANNYSVIVIDANSCSASVNFHLNPIDGWGYNVFLYPTGANCGNNGQVTSITSWGTQPYSYLWSNASTSQNIGNLSGGTYQLTVSDASGCSTTGSTNVSQSCISIITGNVFVDANNNCIWDIQELPAQGINITASGSPGNYYGSVDQNGNYTISVPTNGNYTLTAHNYNFYGPCGSLLLCGNTGQVINILNPGDSSNNNNFAFKGTSGFDLDLFVRWDAGNPGFSKTYQIFPRNFSPNIFPGPGTVTFTYDSNLIYQNSYPAANHDLTSHRLTWTIGSVDPWNYYFNDITISFLVPATLSQSYLLQNDFTISPTTGDCDSANNHLHTSDAVIGSYDPNEKTVEPAGAAYPEDSILTYTIHFQNTGTDSTHFIIVSDTLSHSLDPVSVRTIASSHPYSAFSISGEGILKWTFNPLRLVDSFTNAAGSKGFVKFTVKKRPNLPLGTVISNRSSIYFDYNEPVLTNTVRDTVSQPNYIFEARGTDGVSVKAFPNPFSDVTSIVVEGLNDKFDFELYDLTGQLAKHITSIQTQKFELHRDELAPAVYFYRLVTSSGKAAFGKLVVQ